MSVPKEIRRSEFSGRLVYISVKDEMWLAGGPSRCGAPGQVPIKGVNAASDRATRCGCITCASPLAHLRLAFSSKPSPIPLVHFYFPLRPLVSTPVGALPRPIQLTSHSIYRNNHPTWSRLSFAVLPVSIHPSFPNTASPASAVTCSLPDQNILLTFTLS